MRGIKEVKSGKWETPFLEKSSVFIFGLENDRLGMYKKERGKQDMKLTTAEVKNEWSHTSTPPICFIGADKGNFALLPLPYELTTFCGFSFLCPS